VVATRVGGIVDVIEDGIQGILLDDNAPATVAGAIRTLLAEPGRLDRMSAAARERARLQYGVERLAGQFDQLYQDVLD
jgi:glycosyltransferase involved in cell wall biosynthesis